MPMHKCVFAVLLAVLSGFSAWESTAAPGRTSGSFQIGRTGAAEYSIPIVVPPGINALTPAISLNYSSQGGNGLVGVGWSIGGLSAITRCNKTIAQHGARRGVNLLTGDSGDAFCLDGNVLRKTAGASYGAAGSVYQTELETYSRITAGAAAGPQSFRVERKDGMWVTYGGTADSQIEGVGSATIRVWLASIIEDRFGNQIRMQYIEDAVNGSYRPWKVTWTNRSGSSPLYTMEFFYETRPDTLYAYAAGGPTIETQRLTRIDVTRSSATLTRRYIVSYTTASTTARSRVSQIQECGVGGDCVLPTGFSYFAGAAGYSGSVSTQSTGVEGDLATAAVADFNGDGFADVIFPSKAPGSQPSVYKVHYALGKSSGGFDGPYDSGLQCPYQGPVDGFVCSYSPQDSDGDGRHEVEAAVAGFPNGIFELGTAGGTFVQIASAGPQNVLRADYDGDGRDDSITVGTSCGGHSSAACVTLAAGGGTFAAYVPPAGHNFYGATVFATVAGAWNKTPVDFNGDGAVDLGVVTAPIPGLTGTHTFRALLSAPGASVQADSTITYDPTNVTNFTSGFLPIDVNGDGCSDLLHLITPAARLYISNCHRTGATTVFQPYVVTSIALTYGFADPNDFLIQDWDGDGRQDILFAGTIYRSTGAAFAAGVSAALPANTYQPYLSPKVGDFNGDGQPDLLYATGPTLAWVAHAGSTIPDLLSSTTDGFGYTATAQYAPTTSTAIHASWGGGYPFQAPNRPLYVVSGATRSDGNGTAWAESKYYYGSLSELTGRGWLGFAAIQTQENASGNVQVDYFAQTWPYVGQMTRSDAYAADYTLTQRNEMTLAALGYNSTPGYEFRYFPYRDWHRRKDYELGGPLNGQHVRTEAHQVTAVDSVSGTTTGSTVTVFEPTTANGIAPGRAYYSTRTIPSGYLFNDLTNWCIGRASRSTLANSHDGFGGATAPLRTRATTWNGATCSPTQETIEPDSGTMSVSTTFSRDGFGNVTTELIQPAGMSSRTRVYGFPSGYYPETVQNEAGETTVQAWDYNNGQLASQADPNGVLTLWLYDSMGRRQQETRADGTYTISNWAFCSTGCESRVRMIVDNVEYGNGGGWIGQTTQYFDMFDREIYRYRWAPLVSGNWVITNRGFDAKGRVAYEHMPWLYSAAVFPYESFSYDANDRMTSRSRRIDDANAATQTVSIGYQGRKIVTTDAENHSSAQTTDVLGRVVRSTDANGYYIETDYDGFANPIRVRDTAGVVLQTALYNVRGFRYGATDADLGTWGFSPNALGEVTSRIDANLKTISFQYDLLGRMTDRTEPGPSGGTVYNHWEWGSSNPANYDKGRLNYVVRYGSGGSGIQTYSEDYVWDNKGRLTQTWYALGSAGASILRSYNATNGLLESIEYPSQPVGSGTYRLKLRYEYSHQELVRIKDFNGTDTFWQANAYDARGNVSDESYYNGLRTLSTYDTTTGWLSSRQTGPGGGSTFQNLSYAYYRDGNFKRRQDVGQSLTEEFTYDAVDRLLGSTRNGTSNLAMTYFDNGNVKTNSALGAAQYTYNSTKVHAVATAPGARTYSYDANGNTTSRTGSSVTWYSDNLPRSINGPGVNTSAFEYGPDGNYWLQTAMYADGPEATTYVGGLWEKVVGGSVTAYRNYIKVDGRTVGIWTYRSNNVNTGYHPLPDHLGSTDTVTNHLGQLIVKESYAAFGSRRDASDWDGPTSPANDLAIANTTRRGFTGHTMLDNLSLIHMNGRVFDPIVGRFLSGDPIVDGELNSQGWNRYSYVKNNPLSFTDPTGFACDGPEGCAPVPRPWNIGISTIQQRIMFSDRTRSVLEAAVSVIKVYQLQANRPDTSLLQFSHPDISNDLNAAFDEAEAESVNCYSCTGSETQRIHAAILGGVVALVATRSRAGRATTRAKPALQAPERIIVDSRGNAIPLKPGETLTRSPDGNWVQVRDAAGNPTGTRIDGPHGSRTHPDPRAQQPHAHVPGVTNPDGTPWLPVK